MAGVNERSLVTFAGWPAGIDNLSRETALTMDEQGKKIIALRAIENVDIDAQGKPHRREGRTKILSAGRVHSLWRDPLWPFALVVIDGVLSGFERGAVTFAIEADIDRLQPLSYALVGDRVYWSNGLRSGVVRVDGVAMPWGCPNPEGQPTLASAADGGLFEGKYQVAVTWLLSTGEESGAVLAGTVDIPENGGIQLSNIRVPDDGRVATVRIYVTQANGDVLYQAKDLVPGLTSALIGTGRRGRPLDTQFLDAMPAGQFVRLFNGRLYVASGNVLCWSEALRYGLTHPVNNRLGFSSDGIRLLEPVDDGGAAPGIYVADGKRTYWLGGSDPANFSQIIARPHGVIAGTGLRVPATAFGLESDGTVAYWVGDDGVACLGLPGGHVMPLREHQVVSPVAARGVSMMREQNGNRQVITALAETRRRGLVVGDSAVITIDRYDETSLTD